LTAAGKPRLVFLHGVGLDASMWDGVVAELEDDFACLAQTLPGHGGRTAMPPDDIDGYAHDLARQLPDPAAGPLGLVGFSMGAMVAAAFAEIHPHRVHRLVLMNAVHICDRAARDAVMARLAQSQRDGLGALADAAVQRWFSKAFIEAQPDSVAAVRRVLLANDPAAYQRAYRLFAAADEITAHRLPKILCPVLAMTGGEDVNSTPEMSRSIAAAVADGTCLILEGLAHGASIEDPGRVAGALRTFMAREQAHV